MHVSRRARVVLCDVLTTVDAIYDEELKKSEKQQCFIYAYQGGSLKFSNFLTKKFYIFGCISVHFSILGYLILLNRC